MSKYKNDRIKYCDRCYICINDCKEIFDVGNCQYFSKGFTITEYKDMLREDNVNLKSLCNKYGICYNTMMMMLNGKKYHLTYKYRKVLDSALFEIQEFADSVERFENGE